MKIKTGDHACIVYGLEETETNGINQQQDPISTEGTIRCMYNVN
jgi:hypothetical protein